MNEHGQFIHLIRDEPAEQKVVKHMHSRVTQIVDWSKGGKRKSIGFAPYSARPELICAQRTQARSNVIPEAKVQLQANRQCGVVVIPTPRPVYFLHHRRQVVGGHVLKTLHRFVSRSSQCIARPENVFGWQVQVDVGLRAVVRSFTRIGPLRETLQHQVVGLYAFKYLSDLDVLPRNCGETLQVVTEVFLDTLPHPLRQCSMATLTENQGQAHAVAKEK